MLLEKAIQLVERNALHDLGYNWQDRDGSIVFRSVLPQERWIGMTEIAGG